LVDGFLSATDIQVDFDLDEDLWREIARGFGEYAKRRRATATTHKRLLVDFIVGAHALHRADRLLTLDPQRYRADFPKLSLIGT
jgi:predicted nucleic acid-binding protein